MEISNEDLVKYAENNPGIDYNDIVSGAAKLELSRGSPSSKIFHYCKKSKGNLLFYAGYDKESLRAALEIHAEPEFMSKSLAFSLGEDYLGFLYSGKPTLHSEYVKEQFIDNAITFTSKELELNQEHAFRNMIDALDVQRRKSLPLCPISKRDEMFEDLEILVDLYRDVSGLKADC